MKKLSYKRVIMLLLSFSLLFTSGMSFAYWASQVLGNNNQDTSNIQIGNWPWGIPIYTINDFVTAVTTNQTTPQDYFLANDLDFGNTMPGNWIENDSIVFKGVLNGNGKTLHNISLTARRGIIGVLDGGTVKDLTINNANITYSTSTSTTTGVLIGRIQGSGNIVENVTITNSSVSSNALSGGIAGIVQPDAGGDPGDVTIENVSVTHTTVSGALGNADYGNGGIFGSVNNMSVTMINVVSGTTVTSTGTSSAGGLIGAVLGSSIINIQSASVVNSSLSVTPAGITHGAGGAIGKITGSGHVLNGITVSGTTITSAAPAGGLIGLANQSSATLAITNTTLNTTQINSSLNSLVAGNGGVIGLTSGYSLTMNAVSASVNITNSSTSSAGGILGYVTSTAIINLQNITTQSATIQINTASTSLGAGGTIGYLTGTGHQLNGISVIGTQITSGSPTGGIIGHANHASGTVSINNSSLTSTQITSSLNSTTLGNGGVIGVLTGYNLTINTLTSNAHVTNSSTSSAGGIIGYVTSNAILNFQNVTTSSAIIQINTTSNLNLAAGGTIGYLTGSGHQLNGISVISTQITSGSPTGGIIGHANHASGSLSINNSTLTSTQITSSLNSTTLGNGGVIGVLTGYSLTINTLTSNAFVTNSSTTNAGGVIGYVANSATINLQNTTLNSITIQTPAASNTSLGTGGIIGYLTGTNPIISGASINHLTITGGSSSGGIIGYANQASTTLSITNSNLTNSQISGGINNASRGNGGVIGVLTGYSLTMNTVTSNTNVTNTAATSAGGIIGYVTNGATLNLQDVTTSSATIQINTASTSRGAGGTIGYLTGTGHQLNGIFVIDSQITSGSPSGGIIGYANQASATLSLINSTLTSTEISSSLNSTTLGNGGVIGVLTGFSLTMNNVISNVNITNSSSANAGGMIGFVAATASINLQNITTQSMTIQTTAASNTSLGTGGIIGQLRGNNQVITGVTVDNVTLMGGSSMGGIIGYANQTSTSLTIDNAILVSSQITGALNSTSRGNGGLIGTLTGYSLTMNQVSSSVNVTNTAAAHAGGIIGDVTNGAVLNLENITVHSSSILIEGTGTALGAGGVVGILRGTGHQFTFIRINDMNISSASASGGVIGYANQSGTTQFNNIKVLGGTISSTISNAEVGTGGVIGHTLNYTHTMNDVYVETFVSSNNANVGGIVGYTRSGTVNINRAVVLSSVVVNNPTSSTTIGAGGIVGRNRGTMNVSDVLFSGNLKARINGTQHYIGTIRAIANNVAGSNRYSAQIYFYIDADTPGQLVDTSVLYGYMLGQSAGWANHSILLADFAWSNIPNIESSLLWTYDSVRNSYILLDE